MAFSAIGFIQPGAMQIKKFEFLWSEMCFKLNLFFVVNNMKTSQDMIIIVWVCSVKTYWF